jgi:PAS domain S-box-containing protein
MAAVPKTGSSRKSFESLSFDFSTIHALRRSMNRYRTLFESAGDAIFVFDWEGQVLDVNQVACERLGYSYRELTALRRKELEGPGTAKTAAERRKVLRKRGHIIYEADYLCRDGSSLPVEANCRVIEYDYEPAILTIARDISERIRAQEEKAKLQAQLRQAQKMEALGTLAGGIAHDFNNILTPISGHAEIALFKIGRDNDAVKNLKGIIQAVDRARGLVRQVLSFSRQESEEKQPLQLHTILKEALRLLRASLPTTIDIQQNIGRCGAVLANATQIHQILMNLCTNAGHAMREKGGVLEVSLTEVEIRAGDLAEYLNMKPGSYVRLTISDTGHGMTGEVLDRIFEPYFTTKKEGEGTGMGLSVVHGIVKGHDGDIKVYSEAGKGTTFNIYLPCIQATSRVDDSPVADQIPKGSGNVLLVDDEEKIIEVMVQMLEYLGYTVSSFTDSQEALGSFRKNPDLFDIIITDMTMPGMTGDALARRVQSLRPGLPILLCTGYSRSISREQAKSLGIQEFLMKPPTIGELARTVQRALKSDRPAVSACPPDSESSNVSRNRVGSVTIMPGSPAASSRP